MNRLIAAVLVVFVMLTGCEYSGSFDNPVSRNLSWFDYVGGRGLKEACGAGASDRLRFVYNGNYDEQIRTYDLRALSQKPGAVVSAWVRSAGNLANGVKFTNLLSPWDGDRVEGTMDRKAFAALRAALREDQFSGYRPVGLQLPSNEYYWLVTGCLNGRFHSNAWLYPSERFKTLKFPAKLLAGDHTGIKFRDPATAKIYEDYPIKTRGGRNPSDPSFLIELGANGIVGQ